ncbi:MAG: hypothetical protein JKY48_19450 [Flavobacteriales bacterium]|nr:hypothetical protein [Flavobacteriales bacterium]
MKKITTLLCLCFLLMNSAKAQQDFLMYNMNDIPQSSYSNPSNQFNGKVFIGLPLLSSNYYSVSNSGFAYSDAIKKDGDSLLLDFKSLIKELEDNNFTSFNTKIDLFSLGFQIGKRTQISVNVTENINFRFNYTKDFIRFIYEGNGAFEDNTANFKDIGISANYYREYGLNLSHQFTNKLRLGTRLKYLYGIANIYSKKTDVSLSTDPNTFALSAQADVDIKTSGIDNFDDTEISDFINGKDNSGFGIDLGANYELNKKISFNASILDLGYINWNSDNKNFTIPGGQYTYRGIEFDAFTAGSDSSGNTSFDRVLDSLEEAFDVKETTEGYTTPLVSRVYLGANYKLNEKIIFGGLIQSEFFKGNVSPSFTASVNYKATKWISLATSFTVINRSFNNIGFGFNINPGPVQLYVISDNILGAIQPQHARHAQLRFGINFIIGSNKVKEINPAFDGVTAVKKEKKKKEKEAIEEPKQEIINNHVVEGEENIKAVKDSIQNVKLDSNQLTPTLIETTLDSLNQNGDSTSTTPEIPAIEGEENIETVIDSIQDSKLDSNQTTPTVLKTTLDSLNQNNDSTITAPVIPAIEGEESIEAVIDSIQDPKPDSNQTAPTVLETPLDSLNQNNDSTITAPVIPSIQENELPEVTPAPTPEEGIKPSTEIENDDVNTEDSKKEPVKDGKTTKDTEATEGEKTHPHQP